MIRAEEELQALGVVELRAARGVIRAEEELQALGVLARVLSGTSGNGARAGRKYQQTYAEYRQNEIPSHGDPPFPG